MTLQIPEPAATEALAVIDRGVSAMLSLSELQQRRDTIIEIMANVLEDGKDYGTIPGTDKPTLYKPGAEQLMLTFLLASLDPTIDDLSTSDEIRYRLHVPIENANGRVVAVGIGSASSNEEKYRWRRPVCDEEWTETAEHLRREKWFRGKSGQPNWKGKQIRTSPADVDNTILKMAHKRAFIHGTLLATGASSVFNQDLEDFNLELRESLLEADTTPKKEVQRTAEKVGRVPTTAAASKPANGNGHLVTAPQKVRDVRVTKTKTGQNAGKSLFWIVLWDNSEYSTYDATLAQEAERFKGTDHLVKLGYEQNEWQGKTYRNVKSLALADAEPPQGAPAVDQSEIPFGR